MMMLPSCSVVLMLVLGQAAPDADTKLEAAFGKSLQYERQLNYDDAAKSLLSLTPTLQQGYLVQMRLGWLHYKNAKYPVAREAYEAAIRVSEELPQ